MFLEQPFFHYGIGSLQGQTQRGLESICAIRGQHDYPLITFAAPHPVGSP